MNLMGKLVFTVEDTHLFSVTITSGSPGDVCQWVYSYIVSELAYDRDQWEDEFLSVDLLSAEALIKEIMRQEFESDEYDYYIHAEYPHHPGQLHNCPACEAVCHCNNAGDCVYCYSNVFPVEVEND